MFTLTDWINERNARQEVPPIAPAMTEAAARDVPSVSTILMAADRVAKEPVLVGTLYGYNVYAARDVADDVIKVVDPTTGQETLRFSVNHRYVEGTQIQAAARNALNI